MIRLHLLGFTPDLKGLVFSGRRGGRTGTYWLPVDDALRRAVAQLEEARAERSATRGRGGSGPGAGPARAGKGRGGAGAMAAAPSVTDTQDLPLPPTPPRPESKLSPREIQHLLREGRSLKSVAAMAGVEAEWVERFLGPVLHERAGIVQMTKAAYQSRPRLGTSGLPIGEAVRRNLEARRATAQTLESLEDGWEARRIAPRTWRVRLTFSHRGRKRVAEWEFRTDTRAARPRNKLAAELGWWAGGGPGRTVPVASHPVAGGEGVDREEEPAQTAGEGASQRSEPERRRAPAARRPAGGTQRRAVAPRKRARTSRRRAARRARASSQARTAARAAGASSEARRAARRAGASSEARRAARRAGASSEARRAARRAGASSEARLPAALRAGASAPRRAAKSSRRAAGALRAAGGDRAVQARRRRT